MKRSRKYIICAWILLICFIAGQMMVLSHQHPKAADTSLITKGLLKSALKEKCDLCDAMHHTSMLVEQHTYFTPVSVTTHLFKISQHDFTPIALILAAGRAPPISC